MIEVYYFPRHLRKTLHTFITHYSSPLTSNQSLQYKLHILYICKDQTKKNIFISIFPFYGK